MKKFVYLVQSDDTMPYPELPGDDNDIILLTWKRPADFPSSIFYPESSWNEGRNRLLAEALGRQRQNGWEYLYYIFMDGDCRVTEDRQLARRLNVPLTGNPFRTFERYLTEWEPAVGYTRYDWQHVEPESEVNLGYNYDAIINAFHRETLSALLPYYTGFDAESWLYSQHIINHLTAVLYNPYRIQFNVIRTENQARQGYPIRKKYWWIPTTFLLGALRSDLKQTIRIDNPNSPEPLPDTPRKKDRSYTVSESFIDTHFDIRHPLVRFRQMPNGGAAHRRCSVSGSGKIAVCISGQCRALDRTFRNIRENLLDRLGDADIFMYVPDDEFSHLANLLNPAVLEVERDRPIDERRLVDGKTCRLKAGVQAYLQQLFGLKMVNRLREEYERKTGIRYDCIIRCRPDVLYLNPLPDVKSLDLSYLYVPDFHQFDGCNDRFAVGNPQDMDHYFNKLADIHDYAENWLNANPAALPISAEMFTAGQLRNHGVGVRTLSVRFNRVRADGRVIVDTEAAGSNCC